ncbi:hypothetical protein CNR22_05420 [Sphingobacteriaceae bacterium]|nr:hypothetical protein CNR22_05420 [Sphingobacteriaceae bacterium]
MIRTDKYKKGVMAVSKKAAQLNPLLGCYQAHYLNEEGRFMIQLSNCQLEIDIDIARDYDQNSPLLHEGRIHQAAFAYKPDDRVYKETNKIDQAWRKLFIDVRKSYPGEAEL